MNAEKHRPFGVMIKVTGSNLIYVSEYTCHPGEKHAK
jgi:hypothetical protein